jgi:hypothetical protein
MLASFWSTLLDYLDVLAWPVLVASTLIYVFWRFRENMSGLIDRIVEVRVPGGGALGIAPPQQPANVDEAVLDDDEDEILTQIVNDYEAQLQERGEQYEQQEAQLRSDLFIARLELDLERTYRWIFGSQIQALRALQDAHPASVPRTLVEPIFDAAKAQYPDFHRASTFETWIRFLLNEGIAGSLVEQLGDGTCKVTLKGTAFLATLDANPVFYPPKAF